TRQKLFNAKWFGHIIIGSDIQAGHFVNFLITGRKYDDGKGKVFCSDFFADIKAAHARKHQIQDHKIRLFLLNDLYSLLTFLGDKNFIAFAFKSILKGKYKTWLVFNDNNFFGLACYNSCVTVLTKRIELD